uniref:Rhodanese domain-containing protein n=1 Tax=Oryza barthii TaxID=65489 RepID=A0A0D3FRQ1_9ORYZ
MHGPACGSCGTVALPRKPSRGIGGPAFWTDYEWDIGHFQGAQRPNVDCFRSTSFGLSESEQEMDSSDPLNGIDKENTDILMYCTGGIRCDVYSTILRKKGFRNLYTLKGGVSNYLKEGSAGWVGNLFVFDGRLSLPPATYKPGAGDDDDEEEEEGRNRSSSELGRCYACGSEVVELRHRNCANIDCNRLYLCCGRCVEELRGCCGEGCTAAPRLRPLLPSHQRYHKWHLYRHLDLGAPSSPS